MALIRRSGSSYFSSMPAPRRTTSPIPPRPEPPAAAAPLAQRSALPRARVAPALVLLAAGAYATPGTAALAPPPAAPTPATPHDSPSKLAPANEGATRPQARDAAPPRATSTMGAAEAPAEGVSFADANPLANLGPNTLEAFTGFNLALHIAGVAATPAIITSGTDTAFHNAMVRSQRFEAPSVVGVYLGYGMPVLLGASLMAAGLFGESEHELRAAGAVLQSTLLALSYQTILKTFTGRPAPPTGKLEGDSASEEFRFGFLRGGVHYGWPSGHMMTSTAIYSSLLELYPDNLWISVAGGSVLAGMLGSVALHEESSMHWCSDMVAGTLMGFAIGRGVGKGFADLSQAHRNDEVRWTVSPWAGARGARGLSLAAEF